MLGFPYWEEEGLCFFVGESFSETLKGQPS